MTFNSPMRIPISAMIKVRRRAFLGSLFTPCPFAKILGVIKSSDMACKILGPPRIPPKADDSVAPQTPPRTNSGIAPNSISTLLFVFSISLSIL